MASNNLNRVDVLLINVSVALDRWLTTEGYESSITTNILSTLLSAILMLLKMS